MEKEFSDESFKKDVIEISLQKPVLVDFHAPWCAPCKVIAPIIEELAEEIGDKAIVGKLNTQTHIKTAIDYGIMSVPTLAIFKDGREKERVSGLRSKEEMIRMIEKYL